mmetsp:Transcript_6909/g.11116  ORF Transcript_6909/g.11116 Transcript_6909/m.11116 type:complete len:109 (+) Transcript_6909:376-702(+)
MCDYRYSYHRFQEIIFADYQAKVEFEKVWELADEEEELAKQLDSEMEARFTMNALAVVRETPGSELCFDHSRFIEPFRTPPKTPGEGDGPVPTTIEDHPRDLTCRLVP